VEYDVDVWRYAVLVLHARNNDDDESSNRMQVNENCVDWVLNDGHKCFGKSKLLLTK